MQSLIRCTALMFFCTVPALAQQTAVKLTVTHQPEILSPGSPFVMTVMAAKSLVSLEACWADGRKVVFSSDKKARVWRGVGVVIAKSPGESVLVFTGRFKSRKMFSEPYKAQIVEGKFPPELITRLPEPLNEILSVESDATATDEVLPVGKKSERMQEAFKRVTLKPLWAGNFAEPLDEIKIIGNKDSDFGEKIALRQFRPHKGEDLPVGDGNTVKAMNSGIVVLAEEMVCEGKMVVLDHGQGWLSVYLHLSEIKVEMNQRVTKEQAIALSGESGKCCSGAHLHVGVRWQGVYVNPADVLNLEWPMDEGPPPKPAPVKKPKPTPTEEPKPPATDVAFDFVAEAQRAVWRNQANEQVSLDCAEMAAANCVTVRDGVKLEDGSTQSRVIEMRPVAGGSMAGAYTISKPLQAGDKFLVKIGFAQDAGAGKAIWIVLFQTRPGATAKELGRFDKTYNRSLSVWEIDLSPYAGQSGTFILKTINLAQTDSKGTVWINPRIKR